MTPYRIRASIPPEPPDDDVLRYAARVRDERRRTALVAGLLLAGSALVALPAMVRPEPRCECIVVDEGRTPEHDLPMLPPMPRAPERYRASASILRSIAQDIATLEPRYPELADFDADTRFDAGSLSISYAFLHASSPNASRKKYARAREPQGLYLYVCLVEYSSGWRLDAQVGGYPRLLPPGGKPFVPPLEGPGGPTVYGAIREILERHEREVGGISS